MTSAVPDAVTDEPAVAEWERRLDWPLTILAVLFLGVYAWSVLDTDQSPRTHWWLEVLLWGTWALFAVDYVVRLWLAQRKWRFVRRHVLDLVVILLPMFRQLRALRVITVLTTLHRQVSDDFRGKVGVYVGGATLLVGLSAALAVYDAERNHPDASITTFGDAVWWTITTISTVGYGDRYPVTWEGRIVAGTLMLAGIALLGTVTATIASLFVDKIRVVEDAVEQVEREQEADTGVLLAEIRRLHARLDELQQERGETAPAAPTATAGSTAATAGA